MPGHGVESTVYSALEAFTASLRTEVADSGVSISHFKLGNIDIPSLTAKQRRDGVPAPRLKATPQRRLHDAVFDALTTKRPARTWYVGRGSRTYDVVGRWMPRGAVGWLLGAASTAGPGQRDLVVNDEALAEEGLAGSQGSLSWEKVEQEG